MEQVTARRTVNAPVDEVWDAFTDLDGVEQRLRDVQAVEVLTAGPMGEGTRWLETRRVMGREATEEMVVTDFQPPSRYVVEGDARGARYITELRFAPQGEHATAVEMSFTAEPQNLLARVVSTVTGPLLERTMMRALTRDLDDLKAWVEGGGRASNTS